LLDAIAPAQLRSAFGQHDSMKRIGLLLGGLCGFVSAFGFVLLLLAYISGGSGRQFALLPLPFFGDPVSSGSILIGLVHVMGLAAAAFLCFTVGLGFCAHGIVPDRPSDQSAVPQPNPRPALDAGRTLSSRSEYPSPGASEAGR
jgi:hypothetical protein